MATYRKLPSGRWQARVSRDGKEESIGTFRTKKEAEIEANKVEERIYYGQTLNDRNKLFEDVANEWLHEHKKPNLKESTYKQFEVIVRLHVIPFFKGMKIMRVNRNDVKKWINEFENYSYGSRIRYLSILKGIFHYATHELEILEKNPCDRLKVPVKDKMEIRTDTKYYTLEELNKLLDFMKDYKHQRFEDYQIYYTLMYFLSRTGLRISEALALTWGDIEGNKITVDKQTRRDDNNNITLTTLKNTSSYRIISVDDDVIRALKKFKLRQNELILSRKDFHSNDDGVVFHNYLGNYLTPSTVRDSIRDYCEKAGVEYKGTHVFRHTHAVLLLEAGASIKFVSQRLGHKTIKTTADTYLDITEKIEEDELKKFASYTARPARGI
ncbi:site-specific integrase [Mycobacterium tuberculosis]|uniref:tyrosine-type recombinase/integrase n=1 Tax=Mycobacterium tuberculosis TaxID=1773 RepID=UPI002874EBA4|nr:site-specific integrase [Mycobacterium tuberculosis]MDS0320890.1 site-specific integrase [Mycobacterium tuberculosis]